MVSFVRRNIKSYKILTTRVPVKWLGVIPIPGKFQLRFLVVQEYEHTSEDDSYGKKLGTTIIRHDVEAVVDWYDSLEQAENSLPHWQRNIGTSTLEHV